MQQKEALREFWGDIKGGRLVRQLLWGPAVGRCFGVFGGML